MRSIEDVLAAEDIKQQRVPCPEWDTTVLVQSITLPQRLQVEDAYRLGNKQRACVLLLAYSCKTESGEAWGTLDQLTKLVEQKNSAPVDRLIVAASRVSAMSDEDVEGLAKN